MKIQNRCYNKTNNRYKYYGGRGIEVCDRWLEIDNGLKNFIDDMGKRPSQKYSIERIDNNKNYCPENCKWIPNEYQNKNRSNSIFLTFNDKTQSVKDWSIELNINQSTIYNRLRNQLSIERILAKPMKDGK
jgi:hypothetical protein